VKSLAVLPSSNAFFTASRSSFATLLFSSISFSFYIALIALIKLSNSLYANSGLTLLMMWNVPKSTTIAAVPPITPASQSLQSKKSLVLTIFLLPLTHGIVRLPFSETLLFLGIAVEMP
jgi:hypothetical protein